MGDASWIEMLWTAIALCGAAFSGFNFWNARGDLQVALRLDDPNGRRTLALGTMVAETLRVFVQMVFVTIGIVAMTIPEPPQPHRLPVNLQVEMYLVEYGLVTATSLLALQAFVLYRTRTRVLAAILKEA